MPIVKVDGFKFGEFSTVGAEIVYSSCLTCIIGVKFKR